MKNKNNAVSELDIKNLLEKPIDVKLDIIKKIGMCYKSSDFSDEQKRAAERILSTLIKESDVEVKKTISESVKDSSDISNEIVM